MPPAIRRHARFLALLIVAAFSAGCATTPEQVPVSAESTWRLEPDTDTRTGVVLARGETRETVVARLGRPFRTRKFSANPAIEVLDYRRTVEGPVAMRQIRTGDGIATVRAPVHFLDRVEIFLEQGRLVAVRVSRSRDELRPFGQSD